MTRRALVIGAGVGGMSTAIGLTRAGWRVTVWERWPQIVGIGAALGLWPEAQAGLAAIGVADDFMRDSVPVAAAALYRADGRALLRMAAQSSRAPDVRLISRRRLMEVLVKRAEGIEIHTGVAADGQRLRSVRDDVDVLIGADGLGSVVRAAFFGQRSAPRYSGLVGIRGAVDFESGDYGETWGDGSLFGNTPMEPGRTNFYAAFRAAPDTAVTLADLKDRYAGWRDPISAILAAAHDDDLLRNPIYDLHPRLGRFVEGPVALLGDAAHAMTPHAGRGACEAISDAAALVRHLTTDDVPTALHRYDRERRPSAQRVAARSWNLGRVAHARGQGARARNAAVHVLQPLLR